MTVPHSVVVFQPQCPELNGLAKGLPVLVSLVPNVDVGGCMLIHCPAEPALPQLYACLLTATIGILMLSAGIRVGF